MLTTYFASSQVQNDSILFERNIKEVIISATKTSKSIDELPIPVTIISEKEIQESVDDAEYQDKPWLISEQENNYKKTTSRFNSTGIIIMIPVLFTVVSSITNLCVGGGD